MVGKTPHWIVVNGPNPDSHCIVRPFHLGAYNASVSAAVPQHRSVAAPSEIMISYGRTSGARNIHGIAAPSKAQRLSTGSEAPVGGLWSVAGARTGKVAAGCDSANIAAMW